MLDGMLTRVLEAEVMDTAEEAEEYDAMDHGGVNRRFAEDLLALSRAPRRVVDLGTGTARIPIELCALTAHCSVVAVDLAEHMLTVGLRNVAAAGLSARIELLAADAKGARETLADQAFDVVMSNSLVHHIPAPRALFAESLRLLAPGGLLFVRDLERPSDQAHLHALVERYTAYESEKQRALFADSLRASLTFAEVMELATSFSIPAQCVTRTSDRHWTLAYRSEL